MAIVEKVLQELTEEVTAYLRRLSYSDSRISQYRSAWQRLASYMANNNLRQYTASVGEAFIYHLIGESTYNDLDRWEKDIIQCTNVLTEFQETGVVKFRRIKKFVDLKGPIGETMNGFIAHKKSLGLAQETVDGYKMHFHRFLNYLCENGIYRLDAVNRQLIMNYVDKLGFYTPYTRHTMLALLKRYFRYLYDNNQLETDYSRIIPKSNYKKQPGIPSVYSNEEVEALISAIDRGNPKGKRDYAMILLAARLGLRAEDICTIKFENLKWEQNLIVLIQKKTSHRIELPLLTEIGEAIIDYLKYGRPNSSLPYVFLHVIPPYDRLNRSTLHSTVTLYLRRAGIKHLEKRKRGPHALRHSLAGILLEKKTPLPVISEVLGHSNTESTKFYLRIDLRTLRQCALEVPPLSTGFYEGGL
jgi:integrase/recombinase XerD